MLTLSLSPNGICRRVNRDLNLLYSAGEPLPGLPAFGICLCLSHQLCLLLHLGLGGLLRLPGMSATGLVRDPDEHDFHFIVWPAIFGLMQCGFKSSSCLTYKITPRRHSVHLPDAQHGALVVGEIKIQPEAHPGQSGADLVAFVDLIRGLAVQAAQVHRGHDL